MKHNRILRFWAVMLVITMAFTILPSSVIAETVPVNKVFQTIDADIYEDGSYGTLLSGAGSVNVTGVLPEGTSVKAYPVEVDAENVFAAFDITLFDASGDEYEPDSAVTVDIKTAEIESAIENGAELTVRHITDDDVTEDVAVKAQSGDTVTFEAKSFSVYYIADGTAGGDITYRRTYVFYSLKDNAYAGSTSKSDYEPYYFTIERGGRTMQTNQQTITEGESLLVPQLPYHGDDAFAGWYTGTESGSNIIFGDKATFDTEIMGIQSAGEDQTITLYARFGVEKYLTFFYEPETNPDDDLVYYVYPVVVPSDGTVTVQLFDYLNQSSGLNAGNEDLRHVRAPVPSTKNVFLGWTTDRAGAKASAGYDETAAEVRQNRAVEVSVSMTGCTMKVNGQDIPITNLSFYPIFDNANWVSFDGGKSGNGATYEAPIYIVTTERERYTSLPTITRKGYTFDGWYFDNDYDTTNYALSSSAVRITDSDGNIVNVTDPDALDATYITQVSGGYAICPRIEELTLHAKWVEAPTTYKIAFWAQSATVHYGTERWSSRDFTTYDFLIAVDSSEFNQTAVTGSHIDIDTVRSNYLTYLGTNSDFSQYADTSRFFYNDEKTSADIAGETILADGSAVINIFYDRVWYKFSFFRNFNSTNSTSNTYQSTTSTSNYTHYSFPGGYLLENGTYKYYAGMNYEKAEGPFPNPNNSEKTYYTFNNGTFTQARYAPSRYTSQYLETGTNRTFIECNGADITEKWPRATAGDLNSDSLVYLNTSNYVHSVVYVMPAENRDYKYYYAGNEGDMYAKFFYQTIPGDDNAVEYADPIIDEHFYYVSRNTLVYLGDDMREKNGFTPMAIVGMSGNGNNATPMAFLRTGYNSEGISNFPSNPTSDGSTQIYAYIENNTRYWETYYWRNSYNFIIVDAENISYEYALEHRVYEKPFEDNLLDYDSLGSYNTSGVDFADIIAGTPVKGTQIGRAGDNKIYTFGGVYKDSSCQQLVYDYRGDNAGNLVAGTALANEGMPDHPLTVFVKWNPVEFKVEIDPSEGELTSSTESTYFNVNEGELIKEYNMIERKFVEDPDGDYYYLYIPSTIVADYELDRTGVMRTERYAKYVTIDEFNASEDYKKYYSRGENGEYTYIGDYADAEENPRVYPGAGSVYRYKVDDGSAPTYHFVGWFKVLEDGSLELYNFSTEVHEDTTLKALWRSGQKFRIQYDANEYEFVNGERTDNVIFTGKVENSATKYDTNVGSTNILNYGEGASAIVKYAAKADEENARAQFLYWVDKHGREHDYNDVFTISPDMVDTVIEGEDVIKVVKLTAHYSTIESIGLRYNANTGNDPAVSEIEYYSENHAVTLHSATRDGFENSGKVLAGWSSQPGDNEVEFVLGGKYGINSQDAENGIITLYAVWKSPITVTYDLNGGAFSQTPAGLTGSDQIYTATSYIGGTAPDPSPNPDKSGYTFKYWTTTPNPAAGSSPEQYDFSTELTGEITLYAYYEENQSPTDTISLPVRYFILESNGTMTEITNDSSKWASGGYTNYYNQVVRTLSNVGSTSNDIASSVRIGTNAPGRRLNSTYLQNNNYIKFRKVAIGLGDSGSGTNVKAVKEFTVTQSNNGNNRYGPTSGGSYIKYVDGELQWSTDGSDNSWSTYSTNDTAVYYIFMNNGADTHTFKNITVTTTVTGDTNDPSYNDDTEFNYTVTTTAVGSYPAGTDTFTLKADETRTISLLTTSTANQSMTVTQSTPPTNYTFENVTGGDSQNQNTMSATAAANTSNSEITFTNDFVARGEDPIKPDMDQNITVESHKFTDIPEDDRPAGVSLLNGDTDPDSVITVNVAVLDENGVIVDNLVVTGTPDTLKFYTDQLSDYTTGGYQLQITIDVDNPNDDTVTIADTYVQSNEQGNPYTVIPDNGTLTDKNGIEWTKVDNNTFTTPVEDLFDNGTLKGADDEGALTLPFYSQLRTEKISVVFKYYDRKYNNNAPAALDIDPVGKSVAFKGTMGSESTTQLSVGAAILDVFPNIDGKVDNVLESYKFFTTADDYVNALTTQELSPREGQKALYQSYYGAANGKLHTDCYGRVYGQDGFMSEYNASQEKANDPDQASEEWITYYDASGAKIDDISQADASDVASVVVWGFNTPRSLSFTAQMPADGEELTNGMDGYTVCGAETDVFFGSQMTVTGSCYYNQRVGSAVESSIDNDNRNADTHHLANYGIDGITTDAYLGEIIAPETVSDYVFDGWYAPESKNSTNLIKVSSDINYGDRVFADTIVYAGYTEASAENTGFTLTKNGVEKYVDGSGVLRYRYVTEINGYGYEDSYAFENMALLYIILPADASIDDLGDINTVIENNKDEIESTANEAASSLTGSSYSRKLYDLDVDNVPDGTLINAKAMCYVYAVVPTEADPTNDTAADQPYQIKFTNKNRAQLSLTLKGELTQPGKNYSEIMVLTAVKDNGEWVFSDNYILYVNGE